MRLERVLRLPAEFLAINRGVKLVRALKPGSDIDISRPMVKQRCVERGGSADMAIAAVRMAAVIATGALHMLANEMATRDQGGRAERLPIFWRVFELNELIIDRINCRRTVNIGACPPRLMQGRLSTNQCTVNR